MTASQDGSDECVPELIDSASQFLVALRSSEGLNETLHSRLVEALRRCADDWRDVGYIPRLAVNVLVDIQPTMLAAADAYEPDERNRIIEHAIRLGDLIRNTVKLQS
jgi:hypothetical protein